jgi:TonB family protein
MFLRNGKAPVSRIPTADRNETFNLVQLELNQPRGRSFTVSFLLQVVAIALLVRLAAYTPVQIARRPTQTVELIAPVFPAQQPRPIRITAPRLPKQTPIELPKAEHVPELTAPPVVSKNEPLKPLPQTQPEAPKVAANNFSSAPVAPAPELPKPAVKTDVFASAPSKVTSDLPAQKVQTGGFGDENGFKGQTTETAKLNAPTLGSFDVASGAGHGNGSAGQKGRPGIVASAGFGSGVPAEPTASSTPGGGVHSGGFGDARLASGDGTGTQPKTSPSALVPVEVLDKPQPQYTAEARNLKIEGEVFLKVNFQANGQVQVLQVVRGLGHGLDEAAKVAAEKIRFKPAQREGRPCDMTATVHILFQLAT